jgi:DNA polymerase-4
MSNDAVQWLFVDMNSFFASVEQQENPTLIGKPVAVLPGMSEHTCAIAASYEAKAFGIKTGTIIRDALELCPHLNCVPARHDVITMIKF